MKYVYPVVFYQDEDKVGATAVDIKGCNTFGNDLADAIEMAEDASSMMLSSMEDDNQEVPLASKPEDIQKPEGSIAVSLVVADTDKWRKGNDNKAVKKTLTIPSWMNKKAEQMGINFSQCLQDALCEIFDCEYNGIAVAERKPNYGTHKPRR